MKSLTSGKSFDLLIILMLLLSMKLKARPNTIGYLDWILLLLCIMNSQHMYMFTQSVFISYFYLFVGETFLLEGWMKFIS